MVKNPLASAVDVRDAGLISGLRRPLEEGMTVHSSILAWRIPWDRGAWWARVHWGSVESDKTEQPTHFEFITTGEKERAEFQMQQG